MVLSIKNKNIHRADLGQTVRLRLKSITISSQLPSLNLIVGNSDCERMHQNLTMKDQFYQNERLRQN